MHRALLVAALTLSLPQRAHASGLIDMSSVNQQANDVGNRAHDSVQKALEPDAKDKAGKGKAKAKPKKSNGLIDMSSVNQQANDVGNRAHNSVQSALQSDAKSKPNGKGQTTAKAKPKAKTAKPPRPPVG